MKKIKNLSIDLSPFKKKKKVQIFLNLIRNHLDSKLGQFFQNMFCGLALQRDWQTRLDPSHMLKPGICTYIKNLPHELSHQKAQTILKSCISALAIFLKLTLSLFPRSVCNAYRVINFIPLFPQQLLVSSCAPDQEFHHFELE